MGLIDRVRTEVQAASPRPWSTGVQGTPVPADQEQIGFLNTSADGQFVQDLINNTEKFLALYNAVKDYQPRMNKAQIVLSAQRKALNAALAALEV